MNRDQILKLCQLARLEELADVLAASAMSEQDIRRLLATVTALKDQAIDSAPTMPNLDSLQGGWIPQPVLEQVVRLIQIAVGESRLPRSDS